MRKNRKRRTSRKNMMLSRTTEGNGVAMGGGVTALNVGVGAIMKAAMNVNSVHNHVNIKVINEVNMVVNAMNSNKGLDVSIKKGVNNVGAIGVVVEALKLLDTN